MNPQNGVKDVAVKVIASVLITMEHAASNSYLWHSIICRAPN